jgi:membrane associated rhomboid family serine protease
MQRSAYRPIGRPSYYFPSGVKWLIIINTAIFLFQYVAAVFFNANPLELLALIPQFVVHYGFIWEIFTYMFLHGGLWHIVINMLMLWMFGIDLERDWGTRRFLKYYFACGVGAGLCVIAVAYFRPADMVTPTIGSSGAIFGLLLAYGVVYADRIILMMLLFPMKAKYAVMIFGVIEFILFWQPSRGVSNAAHLGGMLVGYVLLKARFKRRDPVRWVRGQIKDWKTQRARKKFQVYLRKRDADRDRWVN